MYTELSEVTEATGRTVQSITCSNLSGQTVVAFTDGTFVTFGVDHGFEGDDSVVRQELDFESFGFGQSALIRSGIITQEELCQKMEELRDDRRRAREAIERRQFERLRVKYGEEVKENGRG